MTHCLLVCRSRQFLLAKEGTANASCIDKQISNCKSGGGYQLLDSVLSENVDREVARYISGDGRQGYVKHASGLILAWSSVTVYRGEEDQTLWSVNFLTPFTQAPTTWVSSAYSRTLATSLPQIENISTTSVEGWIRSGDHGFNVRIFALSIGK